ncbi:MAG: L-rhamnose isomerase [Coriobacteriia bacterium]|nr:L-rhamnose isomerase [Coriobacteriia bacterium]
MGELSKLASYEIAKTRYAEFGIDVDAIMKKLANKPVSVHCWQGDDVLGFDQEGGLSGGIQTTGNYPGRARNFEELKADFEKAMSMVPGKKRINLHACYAIFTDENPWVDRDKIEYKHFKPWVDWAKEKGYGIDFNPTIFGHPKMNNELSLSSPDKETRDFWIKHSIACRKIAEQIGKELDDQVLLNVWIPDGFKDVPADRLGPRKRLVESLDKIFEEKLPHVIDCVESKVFGIGLESMTVGSNEFYMSYASTREGVYNLIDNGHYHPLENAADKIPAILPFFDKVPLHVTRSVRWDSDHACLFDDTLKEIALEITKTDEAWEKVIVATDFFDASINRVGAWVTGVRAVEKALLFGLLQPNKDLTRMQDTYKFTEKMMTMETFKSLPFGAIWDAYCVMNDVPLDSECYPLVEEYEKDVQSKRD